VFCASPSQLEAHAAHQTLDGLGHHDCLVINERTHPFDAWELTRLRGDETVKVTGSFSTNSDEIARH